MSISDFFVGKILGNYSIVQKLGEGGMGAVYLARDLSLERAVALKVIAPDLARNSQLMARFRVEAIAQARLNHTNIVTIHSFSQQDETFFIVMEFVEGKTLKDILSERGALPVNQALLIISHLLDGIAYAHSKGVLHRDIKPANIFVTSDHNVKIGDFGIAKVEGIDGLTRIGSHLGTPLYSSPEQIRGERTGPATDFYAIGITLYEMVTRRTPFESSTGSNYEILQGHLEKTPPKPTCYNREITPAVEALILRSLSKSPNARFASAAEFKAEVDKLLGGTGETAGKHINIPNIKFPKFHLPKIKPRNGIRIPKIGNPLRGFQLKRRPTSSGTSGFSIANMDRRLLLLILIPLLIIILAMILYSDTGNSGKIYHRHLPGLSLIETARSVK